VYQTSATPGVRRLVPDHVASRGFSACDRAEADRATYITIMLGGPAGVRGAHSDPDSIDLIDDEINEVSDSEEFFLPSPPEFNSEEEAAAVIIEEGEEVDDPEEDEEDDDRSGSTRGPSDKSLAPLPVPLMFFGEYPSKLEGYIFSEKRSAVPTGKRRSKTQPSRAGPTPTPPSGDQASNPLWPIAVLELVIQMWLWVKMLLPEQLRAADIPVALRNLWDRVAMDMSSGLPVFGCFQTCAAAFCNHLIGAVSRSVLPLCVRRCAPDMPFVSSFASPFLNRLLGVRRGQNPNAFPRPNYELFPPLSGSVFQEGRLVLWDAMDPPGDLTPALALHVSRRLKEVKCAEVSMTLRLGHLSVRFFYSYLFLH
jgi:hypothetical protein